MPKELLPDRVGAFRESLEASIPSTFEQDRADLSAMSLSDLLHVFVQWADRLIVPRLRKVLIWDGFLRHSGLDGYPASIHRIGKLSEAGADLTPYLSESVVKTGYARRMKSKDGKVKGINWRDKDYVLNSFDLHHLHLAQAKKENGFVRRANELLFAQFSRAEVVFMMIGDHKSFDDGRLAAAVAESRVDTPLELKGILPAPNPTPHSKRSFLNRRGISTLGQVGNRVVMMDLISTAGTSMFHTRHADAMLGTIGHYEPLLDDPATSAPWFSSAKRQQPKDLQFAWMVSGCDLCAVDHTSQTAFTLLPWRR